MTDAANRERLARLEVHREEHARLLRDLDEKVDATVFYLKSVVGLVTVLLYQVVGGPYADALGNLLGALH